ncbi:unnamed protein product [Boreogadus saida]
MQPRDQGRSRGQPVLQRLWLAHNSKKEKEAGELCAGVCCPVVLGGIGMMELWLWVPPPKKKARGGLASKVDRLAADMADNCGRSSWPFSLGLVGGWLGYCLTLPRLSLTMPSLL